MWGILDKLDFGNIISGSARKVLGLQNRILSLQIHITNKCNLKCSYCYVDKENNPEIPKEKILSLINQARANNITDLQLLGGEPLLHPDIKEIISCASKKGFRVWIFTNAVLIDKSWISFFKRFQDLRLIIKLDSYEGYKIHSGTDLYNMTINKIKLCVDSKIKCYAFIMVTSTNFPHIENLVKTSFWLGAVPIIERYLPTNTLDINKDLEITVIQWNDIIQIYRKYFKNRIPKHNFVSRVLDSHCSCYCSTISINLDGEALPCPYASKELSLGNVNAVPLGRIINNYFRRTNEWNRIPDECISCSHKKLCRGGCKTYAYLQKKRFDVKDSLCSGYPPNATMGSFHD